jgi:hypothetical protein
LLLTENLSSVRSSMSVCLAIASVGRVRVVEVEVEVEVKESKISYLILHSIPKTRTQCREPSQAGRPET